MRQFWSCALLDFPSPQHAFFTNPQRQRLILVGCEQRTRLSANGSEAVACRLWIQSAVNAQRKEATMAGFKTHITTSSLLGIGYGGVAFGLYDVPLPTCVLAGGLCGISGMLPDLDSGSGRPLRESVAFAAAVAPMMMIGRFEQLGMSLESIVLAGALIYLVIRFGLAWFLRKYTVHRGMFHSLPAALIAGEVAFLLVESPDLTIRYYKAGAVVLGFMSHLLLDEIYSVEWYRGRLRLKRSFGTAVKLWSKSPWANLSTYVKLGLLTFVVLNDPIWMQELHHQFDDHTLREVAVQVIEKSVAESRSSRLGFVSKH